jgi:hypothetical protein
MDNPNTAPSSSVSVPLTCFLSSAVSDHELADEVRSVLTELSVIVRTAEDLLPGSDIGAMVVEAVLSADFVCVVLSGASPPSAVMFEAGIATGSQRPVLIVASPQAADQLPTHLLSAPIIRYERGSKKLLQESMRGYIKNVQPIAAQLTVNWDDFLGSNVGRYVGGGWKGQGRFSETRITPRQASVEQLAARLARAGALVSTDDIRTDSVADILASFPALGTSFNPVLIEVKLKAVHKEADLQQIYRFMNNYKARLGLLIYREGGLKPEMRITGSAGVLLLSVDDLLEWDDQRLVREIIKLRNQVVHSA